MGLISARLSQFLDFHVRSPSWRRRSSRFRSLLSIYLSPPSSHLSEGPLLGSDLGPGRASLLPALVSLLCGLLCQVPLAFLSYSAVLNTHPCCAVTPCPWCAQRAAVEPHAKEDIQGSQKTRLCELGLGRARRLVSRPRSQQTFLKGAGGTWGIRTVSSRLSP